MYFLKWIMDRFTKHANSFQAHLIDAKKKFDDRWSQPFSERGSMSDFNVIQTLGTGSFGRVMLVTLRRDDSPYALKMLEKAHVVKTKQVKHTISEIRTMDAFDFPFLIKLEYFFKDNVYLCLVMPFVNGGEMFVHLRHLKKFSEDLTRFYTGQVVLAFEYMHFMGIVYRDLKPENILLDHVGYLKITDYGFCKKIDDQRTYTLCGTPEYLAPEVILSQGYNKSADWWSLGVLIYEMAAGYPPFYSKDPMKIYEKIVSGKFIHANHFSKNLKDLITNILQVDRTRRFGMLKNGSKDVKNHGFFRGFDWDGLLQKKVRPPFAPEVDGTGDARHFECYEELPIKTASRDLYANEFERIEI